MHLLCLIRLHNFETRDELRRCRRCGEVQRHVEDYCGEREWLTVPEFEWAANDDGGTRSRYGAIL